MRLTPDGYEYHAVLRQGHGSLSFATCVDPPVNWIVAEGFITPRLITDELPVVEAFGRQHPEGWDYVVDATRVSMMHPLNPVLLRHIRNKPQIRRYVIIAPGIVRMLGRAVSWLIRHTHILRTASEARTIVGRPVVSIIGK